MLRRIQSVPDVCLLFFAVWTLAANFAYACGLSLFLATVFFLLVSGAVAFLFFRLKPNARVNHQICYLEREEKCRTLRLTLFVVAGVIAILLGAFSPSFPYYWAACLVVSLLASMLALREGEPFDLEEEDEHPSHVWILSGLAIAGAIIALIACRPNWDDSMYLNRSAVVAANFFAPMTHFYTMFLESDKIPFPYPTFPLIAFHDFIGLLSWLTNLEPLEVSAFIITPLGAILVVLAYAKMVRVLFAKHWIWALVGVFVLLITDATSWDQIFSGYAFTRIWQGKSLLLHVVIPMMIANGLLFGSRGGWRNFLFLAAAQTAAVGFSSLGIWVAPFVSGISIFVGVLPTRRFITRLPWGALASFYPVLLGLFAMTKTVNLLDHFFAPPILDKVYLAYFGSEKLVLVWGMAMLLVGTLAPSPRSRLFSAVSIAAVLLTFSNPFLAQYFARYVTSGLVFYRMMWLLPLPVVGAALFCSGFQFRSRLVGIGVFVLLVECYVWGAPDVYALEGKGKVSIGFPGVKVRENTWEVVQFLMKNLKQGSPVVSTETLGYVLPTFRESLHLVTPRRIVVTDTLHSQLGREDEYKRLMTLLQFTSFKIKVEPEFIEDVVTRYNVQAFVLDGTPRMSETFAGLGFRLFRFRSFSVFIRGVDPLLADGFESWTHDMPDGWHATHSVTPTVAEDAGMGIILATTQNTIFRELSSPDPLADCLVSLECKVKAPSSSRARLEIDAAGRKILSKEHPRDGEWHVLTTSIQLPFNYRGNTITVRLATRGENPEDVCQFDDLKCTVWKGTQKALLPSPSKPKPPSAAVVPQKEE